MSKTIRNHILKTKKTKKPILSTVAEEFSFALLWQVEFTCGSWQYKKAANRAASKPGVWPERAHMSRAGRKCITAETKARVIEFAYQWTKGSAHETRAADRGAITRLTHLRHHPPAMP